MTSTTSEVIDLSAAREARDARRKVMHAAMVRIARLSPLASHIGNRVVVVRGAQAGRSGAIVWVGGKHDIARIGIKLLDQTIFVPATFARGEAGALSCHEIDLQIKAIQREPEFAAALKSY